MSKICKYLVPLIFFGFVLGYAGPAQTSGQVSDKELSARIDKLLSDVYKPAQPGAAVLVKKQGKVILRRATASPTLNSTFPSSPT